MKYVGALHSDIRHILLLFNPVNLDEVYVQETHLESRGNNVHGYHTKKPSKFQGNTFKGKIKDKKTTTTKKEEGKSSCTYGKKDGHDDEHCWKLHLDLKPKRYGGKGKPTRVATVQRDLGSDSGMK
jgi:hypothetical protein